MNPGSVLCLFFFLLSRDFKKRIFCGRKTGRTKKQLGKGKPKKVSGFLNFGEIRAVRSIINRNYIHTWDCILPYERAALRV